MTTLSGQGPFSNWYFGLNSDLKFTDSSSPQIVRNSRIFANEGCSSISDSLGNLLFYTNGDVVWNKNHDTMLNGAGLYGNYSSTQSALIVKKPGSIHSFYIFTTDSVPWYPRKMNRGVRYSEVDLSKDGGNGAIVLKNKLLFQLSSEKLTAVKHVDGLSIWVAGIKRNTDSIYAYLVSDTGIVFPPVISRNQGYPIGNSMYNSGIGQSKFSQNGKLFSYIERDTSSRIHIMEFNNLTGVLSKVRTIIKVPEIYGVEFSANGDVLYTSATYPGKIYQAQINTIGSNSKFSDVFKEISINSTLGYIGALQFAPDGRIYVAAAFDSFLHCINSPNRIGAACGFVPRAIKLSGQTRWGLPAFVQSDIYKAPLIVSRTFCQKDTAFLSVKFARYDSLLWDFGDGQSIRAVKDTAIHIYKDSGAYTIKLLVYKRFYTDTLLHKVHIKYIPRQILGKDTIICRGERILLDAGHPNVKQFRWGNGDTLNVIMPADTAGTYRLWYRSVDCYSNDSIILQVASKPKVYLGNDTSFCHAFSHLLNAGSGFKTYQWNTGDTDYTIYVNRAGRYSVKVSDALRCEGGDTIDLDEIKSVKIDLSMDTLTCKYVYLKVLPYPYFRYEWSTGDTGNQIQVSDTGVYYLKQIHRFCSTTDSIRVGVLPTPKVDIGPDTALCRYKTLLSNEQGSYLWNTGERAPWILVSAPGTYSLTISRNGCSSSDTIVLTDCPDPVYFVPNAFSPNGNGLNDHFRVEGQYIKSMGMNIYNGWGELLFRETGSDVSWDGSYKGTVCIPGAYLYAIEIYGDNGRVYLLKGIVYLIR